ncbi:MAG: hypothetical protein K2X87_00035 [Gemmataceae bacterium]|nr:hypothetical protein [Gemmataceae bacterium]
MDEFVDDLGKLGRGCLFPVWLLAWSAFHLFVCQLIGAAVMLPVGVGYAVWHRDPAVAPAVSLGVGALVGVAVYVPWMVIQDAKRRGRKTYEPVDPRYGLREKSTGAGG